MNRWLGNIILCTILFAYVCLGGICFHYLEESYEGEVRENTKKLHHDILENVTCLSNAELQRIMQVLYEAASEGYSIVFNENGTRILSQPPTNWDIYNSLFFSSTVITTIGYGNLTPVTTGGKVFCMFYAIAGIPMCLIFLARIGKEFSKINKKIGDHVNFFKQGSKLDQFSDTILVIFLGMTFVILVPSAVFCAIEGWDYLTAIYFAVITVSTIGFGDYVAGWDASKIESGEEKFAYVGRGVYRWTIAIWILLGLAWFAATINVVQEAIHKTYKGEAVFEDVTEEGELPAKSEEQVQLKGVNEKKPAPSQDLAEKNL